MRFLSILFIIPAMFFSYNDALTFIPVTIKGVVLDTTTNKPVANAYVYIVKGEEESLTDKNGAFSIETWQHLPLLLTVQQANAAVKKIKVITANPTLRIYIKTDKN